MGVSRDAVDLTETNGRGWEGGVAFLFSRIAGGHEL